MDFAHSTKPGHPFGAFIRRLIQCEKKAYKVAVTAGAWKVLTYIFHVLDQQRPFEEIYADLECSRIEKNRERKLKAIRKQ